MSENNGLDPCAKRTGSTTIITKAGPRKIMWRSDASASLAQAGDPKSEPTDIDARMGEIKDALDCAGLLLDRCALIAEWVHHADAKRRVNGQVVQKPRGGRPEGGIAWASRELRIPGKSDEARRKFVDRAIKIDAICSEAKDAACGAGFSENQTALFAIARERALAAQLAKVQEIADRKAAKRRERRSAHGFASNSQCQSEHETLTAPSLENLSGEQEAQLTMLKNSWIEVGELKRVDWEKVDIAVRRRVVDDLLLQETKQ